MISEKTLAQAVKILVETAHPKCVILFGSYARGTAHDDSDADFLVIQLQPVNKAQEMIRLRRALRPLHIPVDVLVFSQREIDDWGHLPGTIIYSALQEGKVMHEASH